MKYSVFQLKIVVLFFCCFLNKVQAQKPKSYYDYLAQATQSFKTGNYTEAKRFYGYALNIDETCEDCKNKIEQCKLELQKQKSVIPIKHVSGIDEAGLVPVFDNSSKKYGLTDKVGILRIGYKYDKAEKIKYGFISVKKGDNSGILDVLGKEIKGFNYYKIDKDKRILDINGMSVLPKDSIIVDRENYLDMIMNRVIVKNNKQKKGVYDCGTKQYTIPPLYDEIEVYDDADDIMEELDKDHIPGFLNNIFDSIIVKVTKGEQVGLMNLNGKWLCSLGRYESLDDDSWDGLIEVSKKEKVGFINTRGFEVIKPIFDYAMSPAGGLIAVSDTSGLYGFIDYRGNKVIDFEFKDVKYTIYNYFPNELCAVLGKYKSKNWTFIDKKGKQAFSLGFLDVTPFIGNYAGVKDYNDSWSLLDNHGNFVKLKYHFTNCTKEFDNDKYYLLFTSDSQPELFLTIDSKGKFTYHGKK